MATKQTDEFANKFYGTVTESAANTLTFSEIPTQVNTFQKVGWVIHKLEWYIPYATLALMVDTADGMQLALTSSNKATALALSDPIVIDLLEITQLLRSAVGYNYFQFPFIRDFTSMPGGGLIVAPRPLFVAAKGVGLATVGTYAVRGHFTARELSAEEYIELVDFYRIVQ